MSRDSRYAVLLRGVNAGPRNRIAMPEFRSALEDAGCGHVQTVAQSGSAVLSHEGDEATVERIVREVLERRFSLDVDVIVRSEAAMRALVADNPLSAIADDGRRQFVVFCSEPHDPARIPEVVPPERLICRPLELHVWCPDGAQNGKLMGALGRRPPAPVTSFRNWNTVSELARLMERASAP